MDGPISFSNSTDTLSHLASVLNCPNTDEALRNTIMSEYIRACVYQTYHGVDDCVPTQSVHTKRVLSSIRKNIWFLWEDLDHWHYTESEHSEGGQFASEVLHRLGSIGDVVKLGEGFWAPGPIRVVWASADGKALPLIFGGTPFELLEKKFSTRVSCVGCARFLHMGHMNIRTMQIEHEVQSLEDWLGCPAEDLASWTRRVIRSLLTNMKVANIDVEGLEIYAPDDFPGKSGHRNWIQASEFGSVPIGLRLCRPSSDMSALYDRPTYLAELQYSSGRTEFRKVAHVPDDIRLRLMFGFEQLKGVKRSVTFEILGQVLRVNISFKLPEPENRILDFGWPVNRDSNGRTVSYEFAYDMKPFLVQVLRRFNIRITTKGEMGTV